MRIGNSFLFLLLFSTQLCATEPLTRARINGVNLCEFVSDEVIAYTTSQGKLGICESKNLKEVASVSCGPAGAWISGVGEGVIVVQVPQAVIGFSANTLKRRFEITTRDIVSTAVSPKQQLIAVFQQSGSVDTFRLRDGKRLGAFATERLLYAQSCMRFEFTEDGGALFCHLRSLRRKDHTTTRITRVEDGKTSHWCNRWDHICGPIQDAALLLQNGADLLLVTRTKGIYQATAGTSDVKLLFVPKANAYSIYTGQIGKRQLAFVCSESWALDIYDLHNNCLCESVNLPKGYIRCCSVSQDRNRLALVVRGEDGENLVVVDLSVYKEGRADGAVCK